MTSLTISRASAPSWMTLYMPSMMGVETPSFLHSTWRDCLHLAVPFFQECLPSSRHSDSVSYYNIPVYMFLSIQETVGMHCACRVPGRTWHFAGG